MISNINSWIQKNKVNFLGLFFPLAIGSIGWSMQVEKRMGRMEVEQQNSSMILNKIETDIHDIRTLVIDEIKRRNP